MQSSQAIRDLMCHDRIWFELVFFASDKEIAMIRSIVFKAGERHHRLYLAVDQGPAKTSVLKFEELSQFCNDMLLKEMATLSVEGIEVTEYACLSEPNKTLEVGFASCKIHMGGGEAIVMRESDELTGILELKREQSGHFFPR